MPRKGPRTPEQKIKENEQDRTRYQNNVNGVRDKELAYAKKYRASLTDEQKKQIRERQKIRYAVNRQDPEWVRRQKEYHRKYYEANKDRVYEKSRNWWKKNPERRRDSARKWRDKNKDKVRQSSLAWYYRNRHHAYGLTDIDYAEMFVGQNGVCAICGRPPKKKRLFVDHDHDSGRVRGLLCWRCNTAIGLLHDDTDTIKSAINYLNGHKVELKNVG